LHQKVFLVIHDDIDLEVGDVRLKFGGGHGGHNGLKRYHQSYRKRLLEIKNRCWPSRKKRVSTQPCP
jgi:peptidyl-tRNA hydrolase